MVRICREYKWTLDYVLDLDLDQGEQLAVLTNRLIEQENQAQEDAAHGVQTGGGASFRGPDADKVDQIYRAARAKKRAARSG